MKGGIEMKKTGSIILSALSVYGFIKLTKEPKVKALGQSFFDIFIAPIAAKIKLKKSPESQTVDTSTL